MTELELVNKYLPVPYKHLGRSMDGADCEGLVILVYRDFGVTLLDDIAYDQDWSEKGGNHILENIYKEWVKVQDPKFIDVAVFCNEQGVAYHLGVYLNRLEFINTSRQGTVVCKFQHRPWVDRLKGFYRHVSRV